MKTIYNHQKDRAASPNEIAKAIILDKIELAHYHVIDNEFDQVYDEAFICEIKRHVLRHHKSLEKKLNVMVDPYLKA